MLNSQSVRIVRNFKKKIIEHFIDMYFMNVVHILVSGTYV